MPMLKDETIATLPLAEQPTRYKKLADDATALAKEAEGHVREAYSVLAEKCLRRSLESEAALHSLQQDSVVPHPVSRTSNGPPRHRIGRDRRQAERRQDPTRDVVDPAWRDTAAQRSTHSGEAPSLRDPFRALARTWLAFRALLAQR
jgi:hypothetical protein